MLNNKGILITGGTGSFGKKFVRMAIDRYPDIKRLVIFSRDEFKQFHMAQEFPTSKYPFMRYFLGDVRDQDRLKRALYGIDYVIHTAALKQVPAAEYNPMEFVKTNVLGAENLINACLANEVKSVVALSTDKAAAPINLYGATKLCSDKLFIAANNIAGGHDLKFSVVRYGNVMGSRGSVIPFFIKKREEGVLPITSFEMTRFNILLEEAVELVFYAIEKALGGELFVPKIPSYRITDLANAIGPGCELTNVGIRPGEKIHEEMITVPDSLSTIDIGPYYAILPQTNRERMNRFLEHFNAQMVEPGFSYNSGNNTEWLTIDQIRSLIKNHLYPDFTW
ncbi:MAG: UDP-N-acetylglucosamine 4,6-dehydratase (inverting) [Bacteroidota bacterium]